jgi:pimeloyl-ACP methyl ester carboxylesterase
MKEFTITVRDYPYRVWDKGTGITLIWLHGMFYSLEIENIFAVFDFDILTKHVRMIRIELPAHGYSPVPCTSDRLTWPSVAADVREIAAKVAAGCYFVGGFSQGAGIAAHIVQNNSDALGLIMAMVPKIWDERPVVRSTYRKLIAKIGRQNDKAVLERLFSLVRYAPLHMGWEEGKSKKICELMLGLPVEAYRIILEGAILSDLPEREIMGNTQLPAFLTGWKDDPNHPYVLLREIEKTMPETEFFPMDNKWHLKSTTFKLLAFIFTYM